MQWWPLTIAPAVAIIVATLVYIWQRRHERGQQILAERRKSYASFIAAAVALRNSIKKSDQSEFESRVDLFLAEYYSVYMIAPESLLHQFVDYEDSLLALKRHWEDASGPEQSETFEALLTEEGQAFFDLLFAMKTDVRGQVSGNGLRLSNDFF